MIIDEERLAELLRDLGASIDVPADGPVRVLAQRDATRRLGPAPGPLGSEARSGPGASPGPSGRLTAWVGRHGRGLGATAAAVAALALTLVIVGSHSGSRLSARYLPVGGAIRSSSAGALKATAGGASVNGASESSAAESPATTAAAAAGPATPGPVTFGPGTTVPGVSTQVVKTGSVDLEVKAGTIGGTIDQLDSLAAGLGGFVASSQTSEGGPSPTGDLTLRVPAARFEQLLTEVRSMGRPISVTTSGQDVTAQYVDLLARIDALEATRQQFLQILAKAEQIGDILSVEEQISDLQVQIEQLQGQQRVLDDQTTYSTLSVHLSEQDGTPVPAAAPGGLSAAWAHARHSFTTGLESVVSWAGGFGVFLVCLAVIGLVGRLGWSAVRRRLV